MGFRSHHLYFSYVYDVTRPLQDLGISGRPKPVERETVAEMDAEARGGGNDGAGLKTGKMPTRSKESAQPTDGHNPSATTTLNSSDGKTVGSSLAHDASGQTATASEDPAVERMTSGIASKQSPLPLRSSTSAPDERFFWNYDALGRLIQTRDELAAKEGSIGFDAERGSREHGAGGSISAAKAVEAVDRWLTPVMSAFVQVERGCRAGENGSAFDLLFVSRRSKFRQGTRYEMRGIDASGNVANFVETEQVKDTWEGVRGGGEL